MVDRVDLALLNLLQIDGLRTSDSLAQDIPLSPSAIARRVRRLRHGGSIARTIALISPRLTRQRLRAAVLVQLSEHADPVGKKALLKRVQSAPQIQFCYELAGAHDLLLMFDCLNMSEFNEVAEAVLMASATVRRFETSFVKHETKFRPFADLGPAK